MRSMVERNPLRLDRPAGSRNTAYSGGTCFGDSGGPDFIGDSWIVGGVTSFRINGNCAGTVGVFRMDTQTAPGFVKQYLH